MPSPTKPTHDKASFFKYVSATTAQTILVNRTLRWSSPVLFNDPFDVPRELAFGFDMRDVRMAGMDKVIGLLTDTSAPTSHLNPRTQLLVALGRWAGASGHLDEVIAGLRDEATTNTDPSPGLEEMRALWRKWIEEFRILCLCERPDNLAMWNHYAEEYSGVVIELRCDVGLDSPWLVAEPVKYYDVRPPLFTPEGWAEFSLRPTNDAVKDLLASYTLTKETAWAYEREWRVVTWARKGEKGLFSDYKVRAPELSSIRLGPKMSDEAKAGVLVAARTIPGIRVLQTELKLDRTVHFNELKS